MKLERGGRNQPKRLRCFVWCDAQKRGEQQVGVAETKSGYGCASPFLLCVCFDQRWRLRERESSCACAHSCMGLCRL